MCSPLTALRLFYLPLCVITFCFSWSFWPSAARAQGSLQSPQPLAPGAEALGRGGAFAAKADSPLALEYNVAGLAALRGTQVLVDGQLWLPQGNGWLCQDPYQPQRTRPCYGGLAALTTDFGVLRRWTFALGFRLPEYVTAYGLTLQSSLDPGSALLTWPPALLLSPSLAVAVRPHPRLSLGLAFEDAMAVSLQPCEGRYDASCAGPRVGWRSLFNPVLQLGVLGLLGAPRAALQLGASVRSSPNLGAAPIGPAGFGGSLDLPWTVRGGARGIFRRDGGAASDIEVDVVAQIYTQRSDEDASYLARNSLGLRLGGSHAISLRRLTLILRAGFLFDGLLPRPGTISDSFSTAGSSPTYSLGGTAGLGIETRRVVFNLGYGYLSQHLGNDGAFVIAGFGQVQSVSSPYSGYAWSDSHLISASLQLRFGAAVSPALY